MDQEMMVKPGRWAKIIVTLVPAILFFLLVYIFTGPYWLPSISPEQAGVYWEECEVSGLMDYSNWQKLQECFGKDSFESAYEDFLKMGDVLHSPFTIIHKPFRLNGRPIFVEQLGFKYYVNYHGRKMGPVFDDVFTKSCCEYGLYSIKAGQGYYAFRGKRAGKYYVVLITVRSDAGDD